MHYLQFCYGNKQLHNSSHQDAGANSYNSAHKLSRGASQMKNKINVKLLIIELLKFLGEYERWLEIRDLYLALIYNCTDLAPIQIFYYFQLHLHWRVLLLSALNK